MFLDVFADVPRGTTLSMKILAALILIFLVTGCNKPDPNPQLQDPIYNDLKQTVNALEGLVQAEEKSLEGFEKELSEVIPQTGQIKYAQKRVQETKERLGRLRQEKTYYELKTEAQERISKKSYTKAFQKGEKWPNPRDWEVYQAEKRLRTAKKTWDVKERMRELGLDSEPASTPASGGH